MLAKLAACPTGPTRWPAVRSDRHTALIATNRAAGPQAEPARQDRVPYRRDCTDCHCRDRRSCPVVLPFTGLDHSEGVAVDAAGNLYVPDPGNERVLKLPVQ